MATKKFQKNQNKEKNQKNIPKAYPTFDKKEMIAKKLESSRV